MTRSIWLEIGTQYLHDIADSVVTYNIPNKLIININSVEVYSYRKCYYGSEKFEAHYTEKSQ